MKMQIRNGDGYWRASLQSAKREMKRVYWSIEESLSDKTPIYIIGDSHAGYFLFKGVRSALVRVVQLPGATAYGLVEDKSTSGARRAINKLLRTVGRGSIVVLQFGEVDCAFSVWKRAHKNGTSPAEEVHEACKNYLSFIGELKQFGIGTVLVGTVPPPTVSDWKRWHGSPIAAFRQQIEATLEERTECTKIFNRILRSSANTGLFRFIDVESDYIDGITGLVKGELVIQDDLHLNWVRAREINLGALAKMGVI